MFLSDLDLTPSALERLRQQAAQRPDYIDLSDSNFTTNGFIFPPDILRECADEYWRTRRYEPHPKGGLCAREAIAQYYARREPPLDISPEHIFITASTSEAYSLLFTLLSRPGDNVLAPIPSYPLFAHLAAMQYIELKPYWLTPSPSPVRTKRGQERRDETPSPVGDVSDGGGLGWGLDVKHLLQQIDDRTRAILHISPHNPTGHVITGKSQIPNPNFQLPLIADEVFCEFPFAVPSVPPIGALYPDATVFHLNGISKTFALPDLKLGWVAISGPRADDYVDRLELLNDTLLSANSLAQFMLPTLFERGMAFVQQMYQQIQGNLRMALDALSAIDRVRVAPPMGGMYLFPEIVNCDNEDMLLEKMLAVGLFAHPGYFYDEERGCHLMISGLLETSKLLEGIDRLKRVLSDG